MRIYLDTCSLCRPFDDQSIDRNRLETEAVLLVLRHVHEGDWEFVTSYALILELNAIASEERREWVTGLLILQTDSVRPGETEYARMDELTLLGLNPMDALHVACAESAACDALLTTDDRFLRAAGKLELTIRVRNPLDWLQEHIANGNR